jgi:hypothetical protein
MKAAAKKIRRAIFLWPDEIDFALASSIVEAAVNRFQNTASPEETPIAYTSPSTRKAKWY